MKHGYWIPISKGFKKALPHDREYTELEAAYSLQLDNDCENTVTVAGYSDLWRWSRKRVYRFLEQMNIKIMYPENTAKKRNQRGFLRVHKATHKRDIKGTYKEHIRLIENNNLEEEKDIKGAKEGHKRDIKGNTTIEPKNLKPKKEKKIYKRKLPDIFILTEKLKKHALDKNIPENEIKDMFDHFKNHHQGKGTLMISWDKAWYTWVANSKRFDNRYKPFDENSYIDIYKED